MTLDGAISQQSFGEQQRRYEYKILRIEKMKATIGSNKCCAANGLELQVESVASEIQRNLAKMQLQKPCKIKANACTKDSLWQ